MLFSLESAFGAVDVGHMTVGGGRKGGRKNTGIPHTVLNGLET